MNTIKQKAQTLFSGKRKTVSLIVVCCAVAVLAAVLLLQGGGDTREDVITIQSAHCTLEYPKEYGDHLKHREVTEGDTAMEIFSMVSGETEMEMFRVYFGIPTQGNPVGYLENIPVTVSVSQYEPADFPDEATRELYYTMMTGINDVISSLASDSRFRESQNPVSEERNKTTLTYWTVPLREGMTCEESTQDDTYRADFYGTVSGEKIHLYTLYIGEGGTDVILGTFLVDGIAKPVSVDSYDLPLGSGWTEDEKYQMTAMMSTVNDVIREIRAHEGFSEALQ